MKGATGMPMEVMVGIIVAVIIILVALIALGWLPSPLGSQSYLGYFESCCISYRLAGHCGVGAEDANFECTVSKDVDDDGNSDGKLSISRLAEKASSAIESCCG